MQRLSFFRKKKFKTPDAEDVLRVKKPSKDEFAPLDFDFRRPPPPVELNGLKLDPSQDEPAEMTPGIIRQHEQYASGDEDKSKRTPSGHGEGPSVDEIIDLAVFERLPKAPILDENTQHDLLSMFSILLPKEWKVVRALLPDAWKWDVEYHSIHARGGDQYGCWTCTPLELNEPKNYPLTIAKAPVVLPVDYRWPPVGGVTPRPDPRPADPIDCRAEASMELIIDLFETFQGSIGFYILINGLLQVIVPKDYDTSWASSHLPHKYGGLKVCYIEHTIEPTMLPVTTETRQAITHGASLEFPNASIASRPANQSAHNPNIKLNNFIETRPLSNHRKDKFSGRIGLKVMTEYGEPLIVMSSHVIIEAVLARSYRDTILGWKSENRLRRLSDDWNTHVEIWAGGEKIGTVYDSFEKGAWIYPNGFNHDVTLVKPTSPAVVKDVVSPIANLGWLNHDSWTSLRQQTSTVRILADTESSQSAKSIRSSRPSDVLVVGEGIFLNQKAAAGSSKTLKDHDASTWKDLVSRALLYRVYPDFDPPNGHSGTALYANGIREDGIEGAGIVGFQSFVQRSGHVQNFEMEGPALERRLQLGRVAFYGAFEVPAELKQYDIV